MICAHYTGPKSCFTCPYSDCIEGKDYPQKTAKTAEQTRTYHREWARRKRAQQLEDELKACGCHDKKSAAIVWANTTAAQTKYHQ